MFWADETILGMSPWKIIEEALARRRPPRKVQWLADELGVSAQVMTNWKLRGRVPPSRFREVSTALGLTVDQLEGFSPLPWDKDDLTWPFLRVPVESFTRLLPEQKIKVEDALIKAIEECERPNSYAVTVDEGIALVNQARLPPRASKRLGRKSA